MSYWNSDKVACPTCKCLYTVRGLPTHRGSFRCAKNCEKAPAIEEVQKIECTRCVGKLRAPKTFINAVTRKNLRAALGVICVRTKMWENSDGDWERIQEYWADEWVITLYTQYLIKKQHKIYDDLVHFSKLTSEQKDLHKQMLLLKYVQL